MRSTSQQQVRTPSTSLAFSPPLSVKSGDEHLVATLVTPVGFWRLLLAVLGFTIYGLFARDLFRIDRGGIWLIMVLGGALVALFEVPFHAAYFVSFALGAYRSSS